MVRMIVSGKPRLYLLLLVCQVSSLEAGRATEPHPSSSVRPCYEVNGPQAKLVQPHINNTIKHQTRSSKLSNIPQTPKSPYSSHRLPSPTRTMASQNQDRLRTHFSSVPDTAHSDRWDDLWKEANVRPPPCTIAQCHLIYTSNTPTPIQQKPPTVKLIRRRCIVLTLGPRPRESCVNRSLGRTL